MKIFLTAILIFISSTAWATTWYVRDGGGTPTQCTGTTNAVYPGSGSGVACAINHPAWVIGSTSGASGLMAAGDTLYIVGDSDISPGNQAQYMIGYGMPNTPNTANCSTSQTFNCEMSPVPAGSDSSHLTKVIGIGTHQPQLWGTQALYYVLILTAGNLDIENLELTQHDSCSYIALGSKNPIYNGFPAACGVRGQLYPAGPWAQVGIQMSGSNITTNNLWVHNFAFGLINFDSTTTNWNDSNSKWEAAGQALTTSFSQKEAFSGTNSMNNDVWAFGGCMEKYPLPNPNDVKDLNNYINCTTQQFDGNGGLGGGFMQQATIGACGNWNISYSQFLFNLKTNIDFLHCDGTGTFNFYRSRSEGSSGEALKLNVATANIEESQLIGDAMIWVSAPFLAIMAPYDGANNPISWTTQQGFEMCRGNSISINAAHPGGIINYINDDVVGECDNIIGATNYGSSSDYTCAGMSINVYNTKIIGGCHEDPFSGQCDPNYLFYSSGYDGNGSGPCAGQVTFNAYNNSCNHVSGTPGCSGTNTVKADPLIVGEKSTALASLLGPTAFYMGTSLGDLLYLQSSSPLKGAATSNVTFTNASSNDYNNFPENTPPDIGAIQYGSCIAVNNYCSINSECCSDVCNSVGTCSSSSVSSMSTTTSLAGSTKITGKTILQ